MCLKLLSNFDMGGYYQRQDDMEGVGMTDNDCVNCANMFASFCGQCSDMDSKPHFKEKAPDKSVAASILHEAATIVDGARQQTHGDRERSFAVIAELWTAYARAAASRHGYEMDFEFCGHDVAVMMALLKVGRAACGNDKQRDHYTDMAGYAALAGELAGVGE